MRTLLLLWVAVVVVHGGSVTGNGSSVVRSWNASDLALTFTVNEIDASVGASATTTTAGRIFYATAPTVTDFTLSYAVTGTYADLINLDNEPVYSVTSGTGSASVDQTGYLTCGSAGTVTVHVDLAYPPYHAAIPLTLSTSSLIPSFISWASVSPPYLPAEMNTEVDSLISSAGSASTGTVSFTHAPNGASTGGNMSLFSAVNDNTGTYTRNTSVWTGSVDWSGVSASKTDGSFARCLTLITPTDAVLANHTVNVSPVGAVYYFVDNSNTTHSATITAEVTISGTDITIAHLTWSGGTPTTLAVYPVLPAGYASYCPDHDLNYFPVVIFNQFRQVFVQDAEMTPFVSGNFNHNLAPEANRSPYTLNVIAGDSSWPIFAVVNGKAVLLCTSHNTLNGPSLADNFSLINAALVSLGSSYSLSAPNLTTPIAYPTF